MAIKLLLSDIDGTLVTDDKRITDATQAAVRRLGQAGIAFTITSSRPHFGMRHLVDALGISVPVGAFNGAVIAGPYLEVLERSLVPAGAAREVVAYFDEQGVDAWLFTETDWYRRDPNGAFVSLETRTLKRDAIVRESFEGLFDDVVKICGSSTDHAKLARCEAEIRRRFGATVGAARSQAYYLDVTAPGLDKGTVLRALSRRLAIAESDIAAIGDMDNDVAMLSIAGMPIAMGNGSEAAKKAASRVSRSNEQDGFAYAVDRFILGRPSDPD